MGGIVEHSFNCAGVDTSAMSIKDSLPLLELCVVPCMTCVKENSCMRLVSLEYGGWRGLQKSILKSPSSTKLEK